MKYLNKDKAYMDADDAEDLASPVSHFEAKLEEIASRLASLPADYSEIGKAELQLEQAAVLLSLERNAEAWDVARNAFDVFARHQQWESAVYACDILFNTEQPEALAALGNGIWLAVTFPEVDPELTVALLDHVIDETPTDSDGAALAAAAALYVTDLRTEGKKHEDLTFFVNQRMAEVARRHSNIQDQEAFSAWINKLELNDPEKFLVRLRNVVDVLVQDEWWVDREAIWASLPVN